jgi:hypothetical protein
MKNTRAIALKLLGVVGALLLVLLPTVAMASPEDWWGAFAGVHIHLDSETIEASGYLSNPQANGYLDMCVTSNVETYGCPGTWGNEVHGTWKFGTGCSAYQDITAEVYLSAYNAYGSSQVTNTDIQNCGSGIDVDPYNFEPAVCWVIEKTATSQVQTFWDCSDD